MNIFQNQIKNLFQQYQNQSDQILKNNQILYDNLEPRFKVLIPGYKDKIESIKKRVELNQQFFEWIISNETESEKKHILNIRELSNHEYQRDNEISNNNNNNNNNNSNITTTTTTENNSTNTINNVNTNSNNNNNNNRGIRRKSSPTQQNHHHQHNQHNHQQHSHNQHQQQHHSFPSSPCDSEISSGGGCTSSPTSSTEYPIPMESDVEGNHYLDDEEYYGSDSFSSSSLVGNIDNEHAIGKLKNVLLHLVRDWSVEGQNERNESYTPILNELEELFDPKKFKNFNRKNIKILCPGAGLGRLTYEIASRGFTVELNEETYFMIFPIYKLFKCDIKPNSISIYPYIHQSKSVQFINEQLRVVKIPDITPDKNLTNINTGNIIISPGDFFEHYKNENESFDCICTSFFIDTQPNIFALIFSIHKLLKKSGVWINNGHLHYNHKSDSCIHLSKDELVVAISSYGFDIVKEKLITCTYTDDIQSLIKTKYHCLFFVAKKR